MVIHDLLITDGEIKKAEEVFLPAGATFDDQRRQIIKSTETIDVMAVPGSGKTTVLLAKLFILAQRMPFNDRKGICVLTHTNVAIDEIKERLGAKAGVLFSYPNFFGTIQSFVDKYLAIPYYTIKTSSRSVVIDPKYYEERLDKRFIYGLRKFPPEVQKNARYYLKSNGDLLKKIQLRKVNGKNVLTEGIYGREITIRRPQRSFIKQGDFLEPDKISIKQWIEHLKLNLLLDGILCYDDAYYLAEIYVNTYKDKLTELFSKRFKYVFIDEVQDVYAHQNYIIESLFNEDVIIQKFGDPNQAIFDIDNTMNPMTWTPNSNSCLKITQTQRFGESISKVLEKVSTDVTHEIIGSPNVESIKPHIILYKHEEVEQVLEKFVELIDKFSLQTSIYSKRNGFKAVGWRGSDTDDRVTKPCLLTYYPSYTKNLKNESTHKKNLLSYLKQQSKEEINNKGIKVYYDSIIAAVLRFLYLVEVKNDKENEVGRYFTKSTLMSYLNEYYKKECLMLKKSIAEWINKIHIGSEQYNSEVHRDIKHCLMNDFKRIWPTINITKAKDFLEDKTIAEDKSNLTKTNKYTSPNYSDIEVELDTVHGVKGETHTATLYLETFYRGILDLKKIMPFLKGKYADKIANQKTARQALKMAYVGMSRPTHLLCLAMNIDGVGQTDIEALKNNGWEIVYIKEYSMV